MLFCSRIDARGFASSLPFSLPIAWRALGSLFALAFTAPLNAQAQGSAPPAPNIEFQRQQQRERKVREELEPRPEVTLQRQERKADQPPSLLVSNETPCFPIRALQLVGDSAPDFQWALAAADRAADGSDDPAIGRCLGARAIAQVMDRVHRQILVRGYVTTRVLAEPQALSGGTLTLTLLPGRIRSIASDNPRTTLWNAMPVRSGQVLNVRELEQGLENLKRLPSVHADVQIEAASDAGGPGESELKLRWQQDRFWRVAGFIDDSGGRATGRMLGGLTLACDHCLGLNDMFYVSMNGNLGSVGGAEPGARGTRSEVLHYSLPFRSLLVELNHSRSRYRQTVAGLNQPYLYSGESENTAIALSHRIHRSAVARSTVGIKAWLRSSRNFIDDTEVQVQRRRTAGWEMSAGHRHLLGNASLDASFAYSRGTGAFHAQPAAEENFAPGISRSRVVRALMQATLPLSVGSQRLRYSTQARAQWNRGPLTTQDQFAIGGRHTVRGFDGERFLMAERGWLVRNELALALGSAASELYLGLDHGEVGGPATAGLTGTRLTGAVLGLRAGAHGLGIDVFMGTPLRRPENFRTANLVSGFNLHWTY